MSRSTPTVLVLGADGLVGHTVFTYLYQKNPKHVFGTTRRNSKKQKNTFIFNAQSCESDYRTIYTSLKKIGYVINCIGSIKQNAITSEDIFLNAQLPHQLEKVTRLTDTHLIHISSDAVFPDTETCVTENSIPSPRSEYGIAKYSGETNFATALTIRTSFIGFHNKKNTGLLEWLLHSKEKTIDGYINQNWSGCSTLQFAQLCDALINKNYFSNIRKQTSVLHFVPLSASKYEILQTACRVLKLQQEIKQVTAAPITRTLKSVFTFESTLLESNQNLERAITQAWQFEYKDSA